jgi:tagaturonate reductase
MLPETILQFGTGKFLRAFVDLFVHELNEGGRPVGRVVAVQSTANERAAAINARGGRYHVAVRGLLEGQTIDRTVEVGSISRALAARSDWAEVLQLARSPALRLVVSNVTEAGYQLAADDAPNDAPPRSFPAKLLAVLRARFEAGLPGLAILPCELLEGNGSRLRGLVLDQAARWNSSAELVDWLQSACAWPSTLVDRIVSAPTPGDALAQRDPLYAVTEPYALWLIEREPPGDLAGLEAHPAVERVERLEPYYLRKVRILNGAHTALVAKAMPLGFETVRQAVLDPQIGPWLRRLVFEEIVPVLEGRTENPGQFARQTLERLTNPFLEHRLADIALHHEVKLQTRLAPTYAEFLQRFGREPPLLAEIAPAPR